jgi:hypothetical protein
MFSIIGDAAFSVVISILFIFFSTVFDSAGCDQSVNNKDVAISPFLSVLEIELLELLLSDLTLLFMLVMNK